MHLDPTDLFMCLSRNIQRVGYRQFQAFVTTFLPNLFDLHHFSANEAFSGPVSIDDIVAAELPTFCLKKRKDMLQITRLVNNVDALYAHIFSQLGSFLTSMTQFLSGATVCGNDTPLGIFGAVIASH